MARKVVLTVGHNVIRFHMSEEVPAFKVIRFHEFGWEEQSVEKLMEELQRWRFVRV